MAGEVARAAPAERAYCSRRAAAVLDKQSLSKESLDMESLDDASAVFVSVLVVVVVVGGGAPVACGAKLPSMLGRTVGLSRLALRRGAGHIALRLPALPPAELWRDVRDAERGWCTTRCWPGPRQPAAPAAAAGGDRGALADAHGALFGGRGPGAAAAAARGALVGEASLATSSGSAAVASASAAAASSSKQALISRANLAALRR